ncbi:two pore channel protein 2-like [Tubulanus polymorphus]|uniref:two pore channel protein 2-like n=1 Tax=Tubulanus polymorphus TaxID=672921 RepID=UPI003DA591CE
MEELESETLLPSGSRLRKEIKDKTNPASAGTSYGTGGGVSSTWSVKSKQKILARSASASGRLLDASIQRGDTSIYDPRLQVIRGGTGENGIDDLATSFQEEEYEVDYDPLTLLQAQVFIEDAAYYRSIHHKVDAKALKLYRVYYSRPIRWLLNINIFVIHILAFFEKPSSLTWTSDIRTRAEQVDPPCGATESIEAVCLVLFVIDLVTKSYLIGKHRVLRSRWILGYFVVLLISIIDWSVSISFLCAEMIRIRRLFRPFFLLQNSSLMKKAMNSLRRSLPEIASVLLLLGFHLFLFTLFGMLLFPRPDDDEGSQYFQKIEDSFMNLLVLLTTANNPDVMMPAYRKNRLFALYFIIFLIIGLYCFMSMLTAVIYNQFRGYFLNSLQASLFRRRLAMRAAYEVLRWRNADQTSRQQAEFNTVPAKILRIVVMKCNIEAEAKTDIIEELKGRMGCMLTADEFHDVLLYLDQEYHKVGRPSMIWEGRPCLRKLQKIVSHQAFTYFGIVVALANVIFITIEVVLNEDRAVISKDTALIYVDLCFIVFYLVEQSLKFWALGWRLYMHDKSNFFDGIVTIVLVVVEIFFLIYGLPKMKKGTSVSTVTLWDIVRLVNMLIIVRLLRIIPQIKMMSLVASTLFDLVKNMKSFLGILFVMYYSFAILGMQLFNGAIKYTNSTNQTNTSYSCGTYQQLDYWANNFDDFAASLVVLWDVMVVNNWFVFLHAYSEATTKWSQLYFIAWWLVSVIIVLNLFIALILDNFIMRWDRSQQQNRERLRRQTLSESLNQSMSSLPISVHEMYRGNLQEPAESELMSELRYHDHLNIV